MKKKLVVVLLTAAMSMSLLAGCGGNSGSSDAKSDAKTEDTKEDSDQVAADKVAKLIDDIYVQERTDKTDEQCKEAKEAWDALTDAQKELVEGENADPDYFGRDTGDASKDDPLNEDEIPYGESGYAQLRLEEKIVAKKGDRFIIRSYSPMDTIGGGIIIDTAPKKHKIYDESVIETLKIKEKGELKDIIEEYLKLNLSNYN